MKKEYLQKHYPYLNETTNIVKRILAVHFFFHISYFVKLSERCKIQPSFKQLVNHQNSKSYVYQQMQKFRISLDEEHSDQ